MAGPAEFVLTLSCPDRTGIVHAVSSWLVADACNILDSDQFRDPDEQRFFMRVHFSGEVDIATLRASFARLPLALGAQWHIHDQQVRPRVLIMVSKMDHCLVDLLYRVRLGELDVEVALVVSNHRDAYAVAAAHDIDFMHLAVTPDTKAAQELRLTEEVARRGIDFIVLARYMQVLSPALCEAMPGRIINIHHSFLPGFKGGRPYHQAHERGVKIIGATAHYVTAGLDEGPIIEQDVERVDHRMDARALAAVGRDVERLVLARAVRCHAEHRVLLNGARTVVFR